MDVRGIPQISENRQQKAYQLPLFSGSVDGGNPIYLLLGKREFSTIVGITTYLGKLTPEVPPSETW